MAALNDKQIRDLALQGMIKPFYGSLVGQLVADGKSEVRNLLSFGLSSFGYDIRLSPKDFRAFRHIPGRVVDPKDFDPRCLEPIELEWDAGFNYFILPAHTYGLGVAIEELDVPRDITVVCLGKSTYARCGVIVNVTPAEAGWRGHLTLEFSNSSDADCRIYANEGVAQLIFLKGEECGVSYADRKGKYQGQDCRVILPRV